MRKSLVLLLIITFGIFSSCNDEFLEKTPLGVVGENQLANAKGVEALLIGAYSLLDGIGTSGNGNWQAAASNYVYGSIASDDAYKGTDAGDQVPQTDIERYVHTPANVYFNNKWRTVYDGVSRANDVIRIAGKAEDIPQARLTEITAEARFIRGHFHFDAAQVFRNIPYVDENVEDFTILGNSGTPWDQIEADFQFAIDNLPVARSQPGRADQWTAKAYKAKVHMFQQEYSEAKTLLDDILNNGPFELMDCYHDNYRIAGNNNAESIFEVQSSVNDGTNGENGNYGDVLNYPYTGGPGTCCGFHQPSQNLVNAHKTDPNTGLPLLDTFNEEDVVNDEGLASSDPFEEHTGTLDPRLDWSVGRRGIPYLDWGDHPGDNWIRDQAFGGPYAPKKNVFYQSEQGSLSTASGWAQGPNANNIRIIRLAHIMLWRAEIAVEENDLEVARDLVNQLRRRARDGCYVLEGGAEDDGSHVGPNGETPAANYFIEEYSEPWTDQATARQAVRFETRLEFAMEGNRFFDLVRWGIADRVLNEYLEVERTKRAYLVGAQFQSGKNEIYPIPLNQLDVMPNLVQNPGYQ